MKELPRQKIVFLVRLSETEIEKVSVAGLIRQLREM